MHPRHFLTLTVCALLFATMAHATEEARFDVAVTDAKARSFFEGLADGTPYNIVLEPAVGGTITLRMHNVTVPEVLDAVREAYGYDYRRLPSGYIIVPPAMQTRLFQINYIDMERRGTSRTRVSSGQVGQAAKSGNNGMNGNGNGGGESGSGMSEPPGGVFGSHGASGQEQNRVVDITGTSISTRSSSDFWRDLEDSLHALVPATGGRAIIFNAQSGVIAVRALPAELRDVQQFLSQIQEISTRQVILEAKILEVELSDGFQAGINWALIGHDGASIIGGSQTGPQNGFGSADLFNQPSKAVSLGAPSVANTITNTLGGAFSVAIKTADFSSFIELLSTQGKTRVLSSPRVSTLNNQKAVIKAGSDEYFVTGVSSNTVVGTASATNRDVDLAAFFSGIALDVTPQIGADGEVIMHIHPTVSDVSEKIKQLTIAGVTDALPLAFSQVRESDSVVKAKSGQLIVIGGLMRTTRAYKDYRTPLLGDIPGLGNLFKSQRRREVRTELVILLRPVVIENDDQWKQLAAEPLDRAVTLDPKSANGLR